MDEVDEKRREDEMGWKWAVRCALVLSAAADAKEAEDGEWIDRAVTRVMCVVVVRRPRLVAALGIRDAGDTTRALSMYWDGDESSREGCIVFEEGDGLSSMAPGRCFCCFEWIVCLDFFGGGRVQVLFRMMFG